MARPLALLLALLAALLAAARGQQQSCLDQIREIVRAPDAQAEIARFIDADTPPDACSVRRCGGDYAACSPDNSARAPLLDDMVLVFSDEFNRDGRDLSVGAGDARWTAEDVYYQPTKDAVVYKPSQVTVRDGKCVLELVKKYNKASAQVCEPKCVVWDNVYRDYTSGFVSGWNKFAFTGGYMEMSVRLPGGPVKGPFVPGFWPAFWTMGNLGRAGYMWSTKGMWPYSYSQCGGGSAPEEAPWAVGTGQLLSGCPDKPGADRAAWGMEPGRGRSAPEFDVFEVLVHPGNGEDLGTGTPEAPGPAYVPPYSSQTLQVAPVLPPGVSWQDADYYELNGLPKPVNIPSGSAEQFGTVENEWRGELGRPGNRFQDSVSTTPFLNASFYDGYHTFGVDWMPGKWLRWYIDGVMTAEVNEHALVGRDAESPGPWEGYRVGQRDIPKEPAYMIYNLGMSEAFGRVDYKNLPFPANMSVDYVRVYQRRNQINVGRDPPGYATTQFIACNKDRYIVRSADNKLVPEKCASGDSVRASSGAAAARTAAAAAAAAVAVALLAAL